MYTCVVRTYTSIMPCFGLLANMMVQESKYEKVNKGIETGNVQDIKKVHRKSQCHLHTLKSCGGKRHVA